MTAPSSPLLPVTTAPAPPCEHDLAERETACADGMCPLCLAAELRARRAAEEAHRRGTGSFEKMAREWWIGADEQDNNSTTIESLASLLAAIHRDAMEKAAGIAERELLNPHPSVQFASAAIVAAIRRAAAEGKI